MNRTIEDRLTARARKGYAAAVAKRAHAMAEECTARRARSLDRKEGAARRAYLQALRLADLEA